MVDLRLTPAAESDLANAYQWYEARHDGLGEDFFDAVGAAFERIELRPDQFPAIHKNIRRALTRRFPFAVFFVVDDEVATVIAVFRQSVDPKRWKQRQ